MGFTSNLYVVASVLVATALSAPYAHNALSAYSHVGEDMRLKVHRTDLSPSYRLPARFPATTDAAVGPGKNEVGLRSLGYSFSALVTLGSQEFRLVVDTGSADTWVADAFFRCYASSPQATCRFGPTLAGTACDQSINYDGDHHFHVQYASGESVWGPIADASIVLAPGLSTVSSIGIASSAYWQGDNHTSGILGLALPHLTSRFPGTDPFLDINCPLNSSTTIINYRGDEVECNTNQYTSLIANLMSAETENNGTVTPLFTNPRQYFSVALSRDTSNSSEGGTLVFGGLPNVSDPAVNATTSSFAVVPLEPLESDDTGEIGYYLVSLDGILLPSFINSSAVPKTTPTPLSPLIPDSDSNSTILRPARRSTTTVLHSLSNANSKAQAVVDTGTTLTYLPSALSSSFNSLFIPPAHRDAYTSLWFLDCTQLSYIPSLGLQIGGQVFETNPEDMVLRSWDQEYDYELEQSVWKETCLSGVQDADEDGEGRVLSVLGQTFLKSVLAVFDIERSRIGFAARRYYES